MEREQQQLCAEYGARYVASPSDAIMGLARGFDPADAPVNGLRHPCAEETTGWFIWSGEELSREPDYFQPIHVRHFVESYPTFAKYLGLEPGWRFLVATGYEDLWFDPELLRI